MKLLQWIALLLFTQCFVYKEAKFGPIFADRSYSYSDRLAFFIILIACYLEAQIWRASIPSPGKGWMLHVTFCTHLYGVSFFDRERLTSLVLSL